MKIQRHNDKLSITELRELCATNAHTFREQTFAALDDALVTIEIDLSQIPFVDSTGLGALVSLHKAANRESERGVTICLLDPAPPVLQVLELTRMHCLFEIAQRPSAPTDESQPSQSSGTPAADPATAPASATLPPTSTPTINTVSPL